MDGVDCVELFGGFQGVSVDEQVESSEIDNSLIPSVNEQFATHTVRLPPGRSSLAKVVSS